MTPPLSWLVVIVGGIALFLLGLGIDALLERAHRRRVGHCPLCDGEEGW